MQKKKKILIIGAGRSTTALIDYLLAEAETENWQIVVCDEEADLIQEKIKTHPAAQGIQLDIHQDLARKSIIQSADIVISMLPAHLHHLVAHDCIEHSKDLVTASYWAPELLKLGRIVKSKGLLFMGELGLDPGIDHMSAMATLNQVREQNGLIKTFKSYTGGLISAESDTNPWHYKITWNPRNVVLAGQGTAVFLKAGQTKYLPYHRLFSNYQTIQVPQVGNFEVYPNRNALKYRSLYGLYEAEEIQRGTIRYPGFCDAWNAIVQIGLADDGLIIEHDGSLSYKDWMHSFFTVGKDLNEAVASLIEQGDVQQVMNQLKWLGLYDERKIPFRKATSAQILENLILDKWSMEPQDKDLVIMQHEITYELEGKEHHLVSTMQYTGEDAKNTAMTKLVGLPLGIFVKNYLKGNFNLKGIHIPIEKEIYTPILRELKDFGVRFNEFVVS